MKTSKPTAKPAKPVKFTHCRLSETGPPSARWRVSWATDQPDGGKTRNRKHFADRRAAAAFAEQLDIDITNEGRAHGGAMPPEVKAAFHNYKTAVADGLPLPSFGELVAAAIADYRARQAARDGLTVAELRERFLAATQGAVGERHGRDLRQRSARFAEVFGTVAAATITAGDIEGWLAGLTSRAGQPLGPRAKNHLRGTVNALFAWAAAPGRSLVPLNPVAAIAKAKESKLAPKAYTPANVRAMLEFAAVRFPDLLPPLALGFFAGLRTSEILSIDLSALAHLPTTKGEFRVDQSKTGPRVAKAWAPLTAWLHCQPRKEGMAWEKTEFALAAAMRELHKAAGVPKIRNGLRATHISYATAETNNPAAVADHCGNSASMISKNYRERVTSAQAAEFFAVLPRESGRVIVPFAVAGS